MFSVISWGSFAFKIYPPTIIERQPKLSLSKRKGMRKEIAEEEMVLHDIGNKKRNRQFLSRKHFCDNSFTTIISKSSTFFFFFSNLAMGNTFKP